jgi:predicted anti-sigma-YlaC factor YlaD
VRKYEVTCRELVELITDYLEGVLPRRVKRGVEAHLDECSGCRAVLAQMRETIRLTGALADDQIPEEHRESLLTAFRDWKAEA